MDCIFCKIIKGKIPCYKIYEDKHFLSFLDINPRNPGHALVIPKKHYRWVWDVENSGEYFKATTKIANAMKKALNAEYVMSIVWGNEVPHAHIWLLPRFKEDGIDIKLGEIKQIDKEKMESYAEKIASFLK